MSAKKTGEAWTPIFPFILPHSTSNYRVLQKNRGVNFLLAQFILRNNSFVVYPSNDVTFSLTLSVTNRFDFTLRCKKNLTRTCPRDFSIKLVKIVSIWKQLVKSGL